MNYRMSRKGENIYKRKDGRWEGRYIKGYHFPDRKAQYGYVYAKSYTEVKEKMRMIRDNRQEYRKNTVPAFLCDITEQWLSMIRNNVKESTYARYYQLIESHIIPEIGTYPIEKITTFFVEEYIAQLLLSGRLDGKGGLSSKTVLDILTIIKRQLVTWSFVRNCLLIGLLLLKRFWFHMVFRKANLYQED